jgi:hypothetical protein
VWNGSEDLTPRHDTHVMSMATGSGRRGGGRSILKLVTSRRASEDGGAVALGPRPASEERTDVLLFKKVVARRGGGRRLDGADLEVLAYDDLPTGMLEYVWNGSRAWHSNYGHQGINFGFASVVSLSQSGGGCAATSSRSARSCEKATPYVVRLPVLEGH